MTEQPTYLVQLELDRHDGSETRYSVGVEITKSGFVLHSNVPPEMIQEFVRYFWEGFDLSTLTEDSQ